MLVGLLERSGVAGCAMSIVLLTAAVAVAQVGGAEAPVAPLEGASGETAVPAVEVGVEGDAVDAPVAPTDGTAPTDVARAPDDAVAPEAAAPLPPHLDAARLAIAEQRGRSIYRSRCATFHGLAGDSRGPAARFLEVVPRDFTSGAYKWRTTTSGELPTDADLMRTVRRGAPGTVMPSWEGRLSLRDMWAVVQYLKTLSARFREEPTVAPLPMPTSVPTFDDASRRRGRLVYVLLQCWTCHGTGGRGDGPAASTLRDDSGLRAIAYDFTSGQMRGGTRPIDIYRTFATGVNGTPMPSYDEALLVGRDGYPDLSRYRQALSPAGMRNLTAFVAQMPTTEALWAMPEERRAAWGTQMRWDLVAYVLSLSEGSALGHYLSAAPYVTR